MPKLESTLVPAQEKLPKGNRYYLYESPDKDERGRQKFSVYILRKEIGKDTPAKMKLSLEWTY